MVGAAWDALAGTEMQPFLSAGSWSLSVGADC